MRWTTTYALAAILSVSACASGGARNLSWNVGIASPNDVQTKSIEVLRQRRYEIERTEPTPSLTIVTHWRNRLPFDDESALGAVEARTRFIVEARPRSRSLGADPSRDDPYNVRLRVENQARMEDGGFTPIRQTPQFEAYAREISEELRTVLLMGIRSE